jgi:hypothetical protein
MAYKPFDTEIFRSRYFIYDLFGINIFGMIQNGDIHIIDLIGNGKTKKHHLHYGHAEQDKQGTPVP